MPTDQSSCNLFAQFIRKVMTDNARIALLNIVYKIIVMLIRKRLEKYDDKKVREYNGNFVT